MQPPGPARRGHQETGEAAAERASEMIPLAYSTGYILCWLCVKKRGCVVVVVGCTVVVARS